MHAIENFRNRFANNHINICGDWISQCVTRLQERNRTVNFELVYEQWLTTDMNLLSTSCLPSNFNTLSLAKQVLQGNFVVQVNSLIDISQPYYSQLQTIRGDDTSNATVSAEVPNAERWEPKPTRMLLLNMTDGTHSIKGMEYETISFLHVGLPPGSKILLYGNLECRKGTILLKRNNVKLLGGKVEDLAVLNSRRNLISSKLGLNEDNTLQRDRSTVGVSNNIDAEQEENVFDDDFPDDFCNDDLERELQLLEDDYYQLVNSDHTNDTESRNEQTRSSVQDAASSSSTENSATVNSTTRTAIDSVNTRTGFNWPRSLDENCKKFPLFSSRSPKKSLFIATNSTVSNNSNKKPKPKLRLNQLRKHSFNSPACTVVGSSASSKGSATINQSSSSSSASIQHQLSAQQTNVASVSNDDMWDEHSDLFINLIEDDFMNSAIDLTDDLDTEMNEAGARISVTNNTVTNNTNSMLPLSTAGENLVTSTAQGSPHSSMSTLLQSELPQPANTDSPAPPFTYISEITTTSSKTYTIRGFIFELLSNVKSSADTGWMLDVLINDGTGSLKVKLSNKLLEELLGFPHKAKAEAKTNPGLYDALLKGVENCCNKLHEFSGLMDIEVTPENTYLTSLRPITEDTIDQLFTAICGSLT